jgi:hypothetical protein
VVVQFLAAAVTGGAWSGGAARSVCSCCCSFLLAGGRRRQRWASWAKRPMGQHACCKNNQKDRWAATSVWAEIED